MTPCAMDGDRHHCLTAGMDDYIASLLHLQKPILSSLSRAPPARIHSYVVFATCVKTLHRFTEPVHDIPEGGHADLASRTQSL